MRRQDGSDAMRSLGSFVGLRDGWLEFFEERAGVRQYDGGYPREEAESLALQDTLRAMRRAAGVQGGPADGGSAAEADRGESASASDAPGANVGG
jgi:hypothetical protein